MAIVDVPPASPSDRGPLNLAKQTEAQRRTARIAGWFFVVTFVTSIPGVVSVRTAAQAHQLHLRSWRPHPHCLGRTLEILLAIANIATAVVLYPILKRQSQSISLGYVASRTLESTVILVGVISVLSVVTLRHDVGGRVQQIAPLLFSSNGRWLRSTTGRSCSAPLSVPGWNRAVPRLPDVQVRPRPKGYGNAGSHRRPSDLRFRDRHPLRRFQERLPGRIPIGTSGNRLGSVAWHLPHRQGIQAVADPCCNPQTVTSPRQPPPQAEQYATLRS